VRVTELALEDFRSYERTTLHLDPGITAFVGPNGEGKTNLLEAVHLLARGDSPRARDDPEMVRWGAVLARVSATVERSEDSKRVEVLLFAPPPGERRRPRRYLVNGAGKRAEDALGTIIVVAFFPEDVELLTAAPAARRRYLDAMIGQVDRAHRTDTREYTRVVEQRNALLRAFAAGRDPEVETVVPTQELAFWDTELCRLAARISIRREEAVRQLIPAFERDATRFAGAAGTTRAYQAQAPGATTEERESAYLALLREKRDRELWQGTTLVGPHREDLLLTGDGRPFAAFASRGEQRSAVLALKLAEARWLRDRSGDPPVFLLDDVLSELDPGRREALVAALPDDAQTLLTAALPAGLPAGVVQRARVVQIPLQPVEGGSLGAGTAAADRR
jgi:DNA replication and repair protein RecF